MHITHHTGAPVHIGRCTDPAHTHSLDSKDQSETKLSLDTTNSVSPTIDPTDFCVCQNKRKIEDDGESTHRVTEDLFLTYETLGWGLVQVLLSPSLIGVK